MSTLASTTSAAHPWSFAYADQVDDDSARSSYVSNCFVLLWLIGTIFYGKTFAYLHIGPLFITEIVLGVLLLENRSRLRRSDILLLVATVAYTALGTIRHGSVIFAGKDIIWMPYLMFLRFFPRNFPRAFSNIVVAACFLKTLSLTAVPVTELFDVQKYRDGIVLLFCYLYLYAKDGKKPGLLSALFFVGMAAIIEFKTLMLVMLALPFLLRIKVPWERFYRPAYAVVLAITVLLMVKFDVSRLVLTASVDVLNGLAGFLQVDVQLGTGTSTWRAEIWNRSISNLYRDGQLLFGQLPGFNFLDNRYLGINLNLSGGQGLGVVRAAHNLIVQITMNAGLVGVFIYISYFFRNVTDRSRLGVFFVLSVFMLGLTADVLEVPSRGPLFFCLMVILANFSNRKPNEQPMREPKAGLPLLSSHEKFPLTPDAALT